MTYGIPETCATAHSLPLQRRPAAGGPEAEVSAVPAVTRWSTPLTGGGALAVLPRHPRAAAQARRLLREVAPVDCAAADTAALLLSEMVSNAVRHARGASIEIAVACDATAGVIIGAVFDGEPGMGGGARSGDRPVAEMETGRGLDLLETLAGSWGVSGVGDRGKWVWFRLTTA
ncbi:ATP-binding protein [Streptomyces sp. FIT100]|uniref:ATP-binding protein n=1 Tax=Streptomyces sp. FIT100 TaxID=2837956 RepID=UPI0021C62078|nr:ATP-binding protein [Streptomyces sp. FIT100]UUN29777.1 ATP-binding protein [Streptomyces sp. FIT100]